MTDPMRCARCENTMFDCRITIGTTDAEVDVTGCPQFFLNQLALDDPDTIDVEATCRSCGHVRFVPEDEWEWA